MTDQKHKAIFGVGTQESVELLLSRVIEALLSEYGTEAVVPKSAELIELRLDDAVIKLDISPNQFWIRIPSDKAGININKFNSALENLHKNIIEPRKDRIGGIATGIGFLD